jgi:hypothetical protein
MSDIAQFMKKCFPGATDIPGTKKVHRKYISFHHIIEAIHCICSSKLDSSFICCPLHKRRNNDVDSCTIYVTCLYLQVTLLYELTLWLAYGPKLAQGRKNPKLQKY